MIYLDHAATSLLLPEVLAEMTPWLGVAANPASAHAAGRAAAAAVERAREDLAALFGRDPAGIVLCSGATEANHAGIRGLGGRRALVSPLEHPSAVAALAGFDVQHLALGPDGVVHVPERVDADLVVCIAVSNEIGTVQPVRALRGAPLHVDATQAAGKVDLRGLDADTIVWSAHKLGGPVGVGALSLRDGGPFPALFAGAQERGRRGGTVNVAGAVGFAAACRLAVREADERRERHAALAARLRPELAALGGTVLGADPVPAITYAVFPELRGETLVQALDLEGVAVSAGSACASGSTVLSPLVQALAPDSGGGVRVSLGPRTTAEEIDGFLAALARVLPVARAAARWERDLSLT